MPRILPDELAELDYSRALVAKPELAWQTKLPSPPTALLPMGADILLVATHRGELYRLDLKTGRRDGRIRRPLRKSLTGQLVYREGPYLFITSSQDTELLAYELTQGRTLWKQQVAGITGHLGLADDLLLAASISGEVAAYDIHDGRLIWHRQLPGRCYRGVRVLDDRILVLNDGGILYALPLRKPSDILLPETNQATETVEDYAHLWKRQLPVTPNAVVGSGEGRLVIGDTDGRLLVVDPAVGETVFQIQMAAPIYSRPLITGGLVVAATAAGEIVALKGSDGFPVWRVREDGLVNHPLLLIGSPQPRAVLVAFARGGLLALDLATGQELWRYDLEKPLDIASLTPDGLVVADRQNHLFHLRIADSTAGEPE
ncbi:MAG: PQQ-binding-like beta-propeller repeat protein [Fidelibacterota bacterium]|nr:MAG: PQQ-binding-like beta-propeller repeat protein [Candidatus Neomarinimicrobiota bacterium]